MVAPEIAVPARRHWYVSVALPVAATASTTLPPTFEVCATGCSVMMGCAITVNAATVLVTEPWLLTTSTV